MKIMDMKTQSVDLSKDKFKEYLNRLYFEKHIITKKVIPFEEFLTNLLYELHVESTAKIFY